MVTLGMVLIMGLWPLSEAGAQSDDDYLDAIAAELEELDPPDQAAPEDFSAAEPDSELSGQAVDESEQPVAQFEGRLRSKYPGSFFLYRKLDEEGRQLVFEEYQDSGSMRSVKARIVELARQR